MRSRVIAAVLLAWAAPVLAQERVIGLLPLPEVFGSGPCVPFEPRAVPLYADPDGAKVVGSIETDRNWSFAPHGGCEGLEVSVHQGTAREELPTREYDYEAPAAIVLERRGLLFKIRLSGSKAAWVQPRAGRFISYEDLLEEFVGVTYVSDGFDGTLAPAFGAARSAGTRVVPGQPVRVIEHRRTGNDWWIHVELLSHSVCVSAREGPPETVARGWLPSHMRSGEPVLWFSSRGC